MSMKPGARFGSFQVTSMLGAGGMGEVYLAKDTVLKREVALKILPRAFASDGERVARFRREAEMLAALNHHNIAQVHGLEQADGATAIVMELVEGPTLADRIEQGPLPPDEAMSIAHQVLAALEAAHAKHIVHRDLKPANVKIKADGSVKVLDFGISKPIDPKAVSGAPSPIATPAVTETGVILGTAAYMSPEQARGKFVDERTDIWAFGCLLFEMLTGQPAFGGEDVMLTLARVLDRATDLSSIPRTISPAVRHTIALCLEKDPNRRIADVRDVRLALEGGFDSGWPSRAGERSALPLWRRALVPGAAMLLGGSIVALALLPPRTEAPPRPVVHYDHVLPADQVLVPGFVVRYFDQSRDGNRFVYSTTNGLYKRERDELEATLIRGTENEPIGFVTFGNRSDEIYFIGRELALKRVSIEGGAITTVMVGENAAEDVTPDPGSILWTSKGDLIIGHRGGISTRTLERNAQPERIIDLPDDQQANGARFLPDGDTLLFALRKMDDDIESARIVAQSLRTGQRTDILARGYYPRYVDSGHLLFMKDGALHAIGFDADTLETIGQDTVVVSDIRLGATQIPQYALADDGTLAYVKRPADTATVDEPPRVGLAWLYPDGRFELLPIEGAGYLQADVSPNGDALAINDFDPSAGGDIKVLDLRRPGTPTTLTRGEPNDQRPLFMPGGRQVVFDRSGEGGGLFLTDANGIGAPRRLTTRPAGFFASVPNWISADGKTLIFERAGQGGSGIYSLDLDSGDVSALIDDPDARETGASVSPDLRYVAYSSDRDGPREVFVSPYPDATADRVKVSTSGGSEPHWDPEGDLYYLDARMILTRVRVQTDPTLDVGEPAQISPFPLLGTPPTRPNYSYDAIGRRFLVRQNSGVVTAASEERRIVVILNWTAWLEGEVPMR